jgi:predicted nuclease of predicted toxin-antitoxin system
MPKAFYKHKITLDENFPHRACFPLLNKQFDVKHIREDLKKGGATDNDVYDFAVISGRIIVTFNIKHFRPLAGTKKDFGIIGVSANMLAPQIDKKLTALLKKKSQKSLAGKYITLLS